MCSRFEQALEEAYDQWRILREAPRDVWHRLNIKPTEPAGTIDAEGFKVRTWWLIPHWAKDVQSAKKYPMFNAKAETLKEKASFRDPWKRSQRCIVPASAFFEWPIIDGKKMCYRIALKAGEPLLLAGLWETWGKGGERRETFTIITGDPLPEVEKVHNRSPALLAVNDVDIWLHGSPDEAEELLKPHSVGEFEIEPIKKPPEK